MEPLIMKKHLIILTALSLSVIVLAGCSVRKDTPSDSSGLIMDESDDVTVYKTKYCDLKYPIRWADTVKAEIDESSAYTVKFAMNDGTPIFDLIFDGQTGFVLGTLVGDDANTVIHFVDYPMDENDSRYNEFCTMAEDVNVIIENLIRDYSFVPGEEIIKEDQTTFEIKTSVAVLQYPAKWQDKVNIDLSDTSVKFSCGEYKLFDLYFDSEEGSLLGTYKGKTIRIVSYDIDPSVISSEMFDQLCAMQEDVNVILQHLMEDTEFIIANG